MRLFGWTTAKSIRFSTEAESKLVAPHINREDAPGLGFELTINGSQRLDVTIDDNETLRMPTLRAHERVLSWLRFADFLCDIAYYHRHDLWGFLAKGDQACGIRLENLLLHQDGDNKSEAQIAEVPEGIFGLSDVDDPVAPLDILLPVYNGADDLELCLSRLIRHTETHHRLIVIDDCSTDPRVEDLLLNLCRTRPGVTLLRTTANSGFVRSANLGLEQATGHVVLLNSDAFVPAGWVDRLIRPILQDASVASVTPMSNNAEILSLPVDSRPWPINCDSIDRIDDIARRIDPRLGNADLPTGVGFCMALARQWLDLVPGFDLQFGRGYGEEVDWCQKTLGQGAKHVSASNLFVGHRGGSSFGAEKEARLAESSREINRRYPEYEARVARFRRSDPLVGPRLALGIAAIDNGTAVPVYLAHRLGGGAEKALQEDIARDLDSRPGAIVLRHGDTPQSNILEIHTKLGITKGLVGNKEMAECISIPRERHVIYSCLVGAPDPLDILAQVTALISEHDRLTVKFHDFFPICPSYNLIASDGRYCQLPDRDACNSCFRALSNLSGQRPESISHWRDKWKSALQRSNEVVVFSHDSRDHVSRVWPELTSKLVVRSHDETTGISPVVAQSRNLKTVGVLGGIGYAKGAAVLRDIARLRRAHFRIVVIGKMDPAYQEDSIVVHGEYSVQQISGLAEQYGVSSWFFPSIWPETYSFTLRECLATGLPVYGFDVGVQGEVLTQHQNGRTVSLNSSASELVDVLIGRT